MKFPIFGILNLKGNEMATNFKRFNNGGKFVNLESVAAVSAPTNFGGAMGDVVFTLIGGGTVTISMSETQFSSLGLPTN